MDTPLAAAAANFSAAMEQTGALASTSAASIREIGFTMKQARQQILNSFRPKRTARMQKPEEMYRDLIKAGIVRIERRRGQPPKIVWL